MKAFNATPMQWRIMEALLIFRYLTPEQIRDLGISININNIRQSGLKPLIKNKPSMLEAKRFISRKGRPLPMVVALNKNSIELLADELRVHPDTLRYPKGGIQYNRDAEHRSATIDCHIRMCQWATKVGANIDLAHLYFDKIGAQKITKGGEVPVTKIELGPAKNDTIEPDSIFGISLAGERLIYALEMHCFPDTGRIADQLIKHGRALQKGAIAQKYGNYSAHLVLSVHENSVTFDRVRARLMGYPGFAPYKGFFLFNTLEQVRSDISKGWVLADGTPFEPFPVPEAEPDVQPASQIFHHNAAAIAASPG